jgi:hypothetical protein
MTSWSDFTAAAPDLAAVARSRLGDPEVVLVGTTRPDGTARITAIEPYFLRGELFLGMMPGSRKAQDVARDPRVTVHSAVADRHGTGGDVKVRGRVVAVAADDVERRTALADAVEARTGFRSEGPYPLYTVDVESVAVLRVEGDQMVTRLWSTAAGERRSTRGNDEP